ncbi:MAG TPA: penicillin-binding transpeptidase domain-containing protein [Solirubrobacterales bacterium]|nr:penicillin-binding transpeptidase domain-containing protein [Solirubrobacterales bacterium]
MSRISPQARRRRNILLRVVPVAILAIVAFVTGVVIAGGSSERDAAERFATSWEQQDFAAMYAELSPAAAAEVSEQDFTRAYARAQRTASLAEVNIGEARGPLDQDGEEVVGIKLEITTDSFGTVNGELAIPVSDEGVEWRSELVFPGLEPGEELERQTRAPERAPILAKDRSPLAEGPAEGRTTVGAGGIVTGEIGAAPQQRAQQMARQGFPEGTLAGNSGLELAFDGVLAGTPGGTLFAAGDAGRRELASGKPAPGKPLRTTLDPGLQQAAADALGDQFGGVAVLDARNGEIRALSGIAFSAPQPPGSTFKIITTVGGLAEGLTEPSREYPVVTSADAGGREIDNAHEEPCGGNLVVSFAKSCNTVFAPLGVELGAEKLLEYTEAFGFNAPPAIYNDAALAATQPPASTIPDPIGDPVEVGVSAIGQGKVLATPLQMASVAQTIAADGVRSPTPLVKGAGLGPEMEPVQVTTPKIAEQVGEMMVEVVSNGTGSAASLPNAAVAGKTGTAELGPKPGQQFDPSNPDAEPELEVDAWFTAYAPAKNPKLAIAVMIVNADGDGGVIAAPIARQVLAAGL